MDGIALIVVGLLVIFGVGGISIKNFIQKVDRANATPENPTTQMSVTSQGSPYPSGIGSFSPLPNKMPPAAVAPSAKIFFIIGGFGTLIIGIATIYSGSWLIGLLLLIACPILFVQATKADERHAQNMRHRAEAQRSHAEIERARVDAETVRHAAQHQAHLWEAEAVTLMAKAAADKKEQEFREQNIAIKTSFASQAQNAGVTIETFTQANAQRMMNQIEVDQRAAFDDLESKKAWLAAQQELDAADLIDLASNQKIKKLLGDYQLYLGYLIVLENDQTMPNEPKKQLRSQYNGYLKDVERQIDALKTKPVSAKNGKKAQSNARGASNARADYPPEADSDTE